MVKDFTAHTTLNWGLSIFLNFMAEHKKLFQVKLQL